MIILSLDIKSCDAMVSFNASCTLSQSAFSMFDTVEDISIVVSGPKFTTKMETKKKICNNMNANPTKHFSFIVNVKYVQFI